MQTAMHEPPRAAEEPSPLAVAVFIRMDLYRQSVTIARDKIGRFQHTSNVVIIMPAAICRTATASSTPSVEEDFKRATAVSFSCIVWY
jgi:hypothetical protein